MKHKNKNLILIRGLVGIVLLFSAFCALAPFGYMTLVSLTEKTVLDLNFSNVEFSLVNYDRVFRNFNLARNFINSIIVTTMACVLNCIISAMAVYGKCTG